MNTSLIAKRYAKGFFDFAKESHSYESLNDEMKSYLGIIQDNAELVSFLEDPFIPVEDKKHLLNNVFASYSEIFRNILSLLVEHKRYAFIPDVFHQFNGFVKESKGIYEVKLVLAQDLSDGQIENLVRKSDLLPKNASFEVSKEIDASIIGG